jgi:hypothetical protein
MFLSRYYYGFLDSVGLCLYEVASVGQVTEHSVAQNGWLSLGFTVEIFLSHFLLLLILYCSFFIYAYFSMPKLFLIYSYMDTL